MIYIIDIDGTIADNTHRQSYLQKTCTTCLGPVPPQHRAPCPNCGDDTATIPQSSWDTFLDPDLMSQDSPVPEAQRVISHLQKANIPYHFLTGRNESLRDVTTAWLQKYYNFDASKQKLLMRPVTKAGITASDYKEMTFLKLRDELGHDQKYIFCEDDRHVFSMYSKYGLVLACPQAWEYLMPIGLSRINEPLWNL